MLLANKAFCSGVTVCALCISILMFISRVHVMPGLKGRCFLSLCKQACNGAHKRLHKTEWFNGPLKAKLRHMEQEIGFQGGA